MSSHCRILWSPKFFSTQPESKVYLRSINIPIQIAICGHRLQSIPTDSNLWPQIRICGNELKICGHSLDCNLFPQIQICSHRLQPVATDSISFPQIQMCGQILDFLFWTAMLEIRNTAIASLYLAGECPAEKLKKNAVIVYGHVVILRSQNKITDFLMILAWACPFNGCVGLDDRV